MPLNLMVPPLALSFSEVKFRPCTFLVINLIAVATCFAQASDQRSTTAQNQVLESVSVKGDLYPADADANQEIQATLARALSEKKQVLLVFGANWCYDCHVLDRALHEGTAGKIVSEHFLLVHVDIGEGKKNGELVKLYRVPLDKGVPAVAVLRGDGKLLYSSGDGEFEAARRMMKKDLVAFLNRWKSSER